MPAPRKNPGRTARRPKKKEADSLVKLSIAAGDPLQPGGLAEYAAATKDKARASEAASAAADKRRADRGVALKAAQARWSSRQKGR
jgi:chromosome segregation and condensation protein ScpB